MAKAPAFQFYVRDWLADPQLQMVSYSTKGIWIDLLCYLWESPDRGKLEATHKQFIKMLGCNQEEWDTFFTEASVTKFADVTNSNGIVTVCNRRMFREEKDRKNTRLRVQRYREKQDSNATSNAFVTPPSSSSSSYKEKDIQLSVVLRDGSFYEIGPEKVREYQQTYQKIDVIQELKNCAQWNKDNPGKRKTKAGILKHINTWLKSANDKKVYISKAPESEPWKAEDHEEISQEQKDKMRKKIGALGKGKRTNKTMALGDIIKGNI